MRQRKGLEMFFEIPKNEYSYRFLITIPQTCSGQQQDGWIWSEIKEPGFVRLESVIPAMRKEVSMYDELGLAHTLVILYLLSR